MAEVNLSSEQLDKLKAAMARVKGKNAQAAQPAAQQPPDTGNDEIEEIRVSGDKLPF